MGQRRAKRGLAGRRSAHRRGIAARWPASRNLARIAVAYFSGQYRLNLVGLVEGQFAPTQCRALQPPRRCQRACHRCRRRLAIRRNHARRHHATQLWWRTGRAGRLASSCFDLDARTDHALSRRSRLCDTDSVDPRTFNNGLVGADAAETVAVAPAAASISPVAPAAAAPAPAAAAPRVAVADLPEWSGDSGPSRGRSPNLAPGSPRARPGAGRCGRNPYEFRRRDR